MNCKQTRPLLSGFLDEQLSVDQTARLGRHVETCRSCEAELRSLETAQTMLRGLPPVTARPGFWAEAYEQVARSSRRPEPWWRRLSHPQRSGLVLAPAFVGAMLAIGLQFQPVPSSSEASTLPDHVDEMVQAHLEARTVQPLLDQGVIRMVLANSESTDDPTVDE